MNSSRTTTFCEYHAQKRRLERHPIEPILAFVLFKGLKVVQAQACLFFFFLFSDRAKLPVTNIYTTNYTNKSVKTRKKS